MKNGCDRIIRCVCFGLFSQTQIDQLQRQQKLLRRRSEYQQALLYVKKEATTILQRINLINKQIAAWKEMMRLQHGDCSPEKEQSRLELRSGG